MTRAARLLLVAGLSLGCVSIERWFADQKLPQPDAREVHAREGEAFDHGALTEVLKDIIDADGRVRYERLRSNPAPLRAYADQLADVDYTRLSRDHKLATLMNAYNAFTLLLILDHWPVASIQDIPAKERWDAARWTLGGEVVSLSDIEHARLRSAFVEPRIHFGINCASESCPPLLPEAFEGERVNAQLERLAEMVHEPSRRWFAFERHDDRARVELFRVYLWFHRDFERAAETSARYAAQWSPPLQRAFDEGVEVEVDYQPYDWSLNQSREERAGPKSSGPAGGSTG